MQAQQEIQTLKETNGSKKAQKSNDSAAFEQYASQCKIKPYPEPNGPFAPEVVSGGSLRDTMVIQHKEEEEQFLQGKGNIQLADNKNEIPVKSNNTGMPDNLKNGIENLSGYSMDDVKVYYNSSKPAQLQALAYAQGSDIHIAPGQEQHLPHEAWHVVQQKQGRVQPTMQMKEGIAVNDDKGLEKEADAMGSKAASTRTSSTSLQLKEIQSNSHEGSIQRYITDGNGTPLSKSEVLKQIGNSINESLLIKYFNSEHGYVLQDVIESITKGTDATLSYPFTNTVQKFDVGCSVCVAANYLGLTDQALIKQIFDSGNRDIIDCVKRLYKGGNKDDVLKLYQWLRIFLAEEVFDNAESMIKNITSDDEAYDWTGAIVWEGHIIRASGNGVQYTFWDPQSGANNCTIPQNKRLYLITFSAGSSSSSSSSSSNSTTSISSGSTSSATSNSGSDNNGSASISASSTSSNSSLNNPGS